MISIVILNWNKPNLTLRCLQSLMATGESAQCQVILVDNGSSAANKKLLWDAVEDYELVKVDLAINRFFGEGNNIGVEAASGDLVLFLNNDVEVRPGWLEPLVKKLTSSAKVGAVAPKFLYPDGTVQEIGALLDMTGKPLQLGKGMRSEPLSLKRSQRVDYVSAACLLIRKADFEAIGGFHHAFEPAYYEDTELCHQLALIGKEVWCVPEAEVIHLESQTTADPALGKGFSSFAEVNRLKFLQRRDVRAGLPTEAQGITKKGSRGRVAVLVSEGMHLGQNAGRALFSADVMQRAGFDVALLGPERYSKLRVGQMCQDLGLPSLNLPVQKLETPQGKVPFDFAIDSGAAPLLDRDWAGVPVVRIADIPLANIPSGAKISDSLVEHQILSVGKFDPSHPGANQPLLIKALKSLIDAGHQGTLNLVGPLYAAKTSLNFFNRCVRLAEGYPVNFFPNASAMLLGELLDTSGLYWSARGFGLDWDLELAAPLAKSAGIAEAMSRGAICIAYGPSVSGDLIEFGVNGFRFLSEQSLIRRTILSWQMPKGDLARMRKAAAVRPLDYSRTSFERTLISRLPI